MSRQIRGIHHVTAIASNPQTNLDFYTGVLGLRLVKKTINFDDPGTYHFYFGDATGTPGTILTFFPIPRAFQGTPGVGQATITALAVPVGALGYWKDRLNSVTVGAEPGEDFGQPSLTFRDPDGMIVELVETSADGPGDAWADGPIPVEYAIRGVHHVVLQEAAYEPTVTLLTETMGFRHVESVGHRHRFAAGDGGPGALVDVLVTPDGAPGRNAAGTVHHIAFRADDDAAQFEWREVLMAQGLDVSPVRDRQYFRSIYYREPGGVLFEIATDGPGFATDEPVDALGTQLKLPPWIEAGRKHVEARLPALTSPTYTKEARLMTDTPNGFTHVYQDGDGPLTLLLLHGTGGDEQSLIGLARDLAPNARLLSLRGKVMEGTLTRFFRRLAEGVFDTEDLIFRTNEVADFVIEASQTYGFDLSSVVALGYSNGANIAGGLLLLRPEVLAGAVLLRPMVPLLPETLPTLEGRPVFVAAGENDELITREQPESLAKLLEQAGADVTVRWDPGTHKLSRQDLEEVERWLGARWG